MFFEEIEDSLVNGNYIKRFSVINRTKYGTARTNQCLIKIDVILGVVIGIFSTNNCQ